MKLSTLYLNYFPEIILIIFTYIFSAQKEIIFLLILISVFSVFLILNFIVICNPDKEILDLCKCEKASDGGSFIGCLIIIVVFVVFFLILLLFKNLSSKGKIIFFHIFSGLISVTIIIYIFLKHEEKDNFNYIAIIFNIINLSFLIITPIFIGIINLCIQLFSQNNKQKDESSFSNQLINQKTTNDNETNEKDYNNSNLSGNTNYTNQTKTNEGNSNYNNNNSYNNNLENKNYNNMNNNNYNNINHVIIADIQNINSLDGLPTKEEIENQTKN